jgi:outer membrane biogenesis lipoprotein LolB
MPSKEAVDSQQQRLQGLEQDGWQIDYGSYMPAPQAGSASLPAKMTVQRSGVRVRLIVDGWSS